MSGQRILVIEDNAKNLKLVRDVLEYAGYDVVPAETGERGLELAAEMAPDLVLMDLQLPGSSTEVPLSLVTFPISILAWLAGSRGAGGPYRLSSSRLAVRVFLSSSRIWAT